jgi:ECF sigma factor
MGAERPDHTLQTTALVNEAYLRLADQTNPRWQNRAKEATFLQLNQLCPNRK